MFIVIALGLALLLFLLVFQPRIKTRPDRQRPATRQREDSDGIIYGETPDGHWHGGALPDDRSQSDDRLEPGGGDFGGGGASGDWSDSPDSSSSDSSSSDSRD